LSATIGRGTWIDKLASELVAREEALGRDTSMIRVESGLGASGVPHIGSLGDAVRAYGVALALRDMGHRSELVAYSDDMDGLRRVPAGMEGAGLEEQVGRPVSSIGDPDGCHASYGAHMSSLLLGALDALGIEYEHMSAREAYAAGRFAGQAAEILGAAGRIGDHIAGATGQEKFRGALPYWPVCESCGRLYTAVAREHLGGGRVSYECAGAEIGGRRVDGCGHAGEADAARGPGKLAWKVEFAARWDALDVRFEAYGKDIMDSVMVNDWVSENVLGRAPPHHVRYEMFLDRAGGKISKSSGNVLTPQEWLRYGTPQSLLLLLYKRIAGARRVGVEDVPQLMDELARLERLYFGAEDEPNAERAARLRGLYEYAHLLSPPPERQERAPYGLLVELARAFREDREAIVARRLVEYGTVREPGEALAESIRLAGRYADERAGGGAGGSAAEMGEGARAALLEVADALDAGGDAHAAVREASKRHGVQAREVFRAAYLALIGAPSGPRLGRFVDDIGPSRAAAMIREGA